ncbi:jg14886 [Pararge aegeria aegeria]|uniref:Jg14886 protein n=1 Tax=Pararge aegeria aegeria TaxID=348720 RepID=A0A8S4R5S3_9NEOP|nr:jg14886 [Pararge aegeria aegeria]
MEGRVRFTSNRAEVRVLAGGTLGLTSHPPSPDVVELWGSSHGELSHSPHSAGDAVATPPSNLPVVIGKFSRKKTRLIKPQNGEYVCKFI